MSKKNKAIEVRIEESPEKKDGKMVTVSKLLLGKKEIGSIITDDQKKFLIVIDNRTELIVKNFDEAVEYIIRQWNLND